MNQSEDAFESIEDFLKTASGEWEPAGIISREALCQQWEKRISSLIKMESSYEGALMEEVKESRAQVSRLEEMLARMKEIHKKIKSENREPKRK